MLKPILLLLALGSSPVHSMPPPALNCKPQLDIDELYKIKAKLSKTNAESTVKTNGKDFIIDNRKELYKSLFEQCLYNKLLPSKWQSFSYREQHRLFSFLLHVNFYFPDSYLLETMIAIVKHMESKGKFIDNMLVSIHEAIVRSRKITEARALEATYPYITFSKTFPMISSEINLRSYLYLDTTNKQLIKKGFKFPSTGYVVVISSPLCSPSKRFTTWLNLKKNSTFKEVFTNNAIFLTPTDSTLYIDALSTLNKSIAPIQMHYSIDRNEWPEIQLWDTPTFYFYHNGVLKSQLVGWKSNEVSKQLMEHLNNIELFFRK